MIRICCQVSKDEYNFLKKLKFDNDTTFDKILRTALFNYLKTHNSVTPKKENEHE